MSTPSTPAGAAPSLPPVKIVALCGSLRAESFTRKALRLALEGVTKMGGEVTLVDLAEWPLPPFDGEPSKNHPDALRFRAAVAECEGLLIATPVYHDSFGGMLKNAIDLLYDELLERVAAVIAVGGGRVGQGQALEHLRAVLRETGTWVIPRQVVIGGSETAFDEAGRLKEKELEARLVMLGQELVLRCRAMKPKRRVK